MKKEKKGLDSLNPFGRTDITLKQDIQFILYTLNISRKRFQDIYFSIFVIAFIAKFENIFFGHQFTVIRKNVREEVKCH